MVDILMSIDERFVMQMMVTVASLRKNNPSLPLRIHLLTTAVNDADKERIHRFVEQDGRSTILFYEPLQHLVDHPLIPKEGRFPLSAYMRCFATELLPTDLDRILYLDADLLVRGSITELWQTDLGDHPLAAVDDMWARRGNSERLDIPPSDSYFNSGVLLINLRRWRNIDMPALTLRTIERLHNVLRFPDQDVLNVLFHADRLPLPVRFNMQDAFFRRRRQWIQPQLLPEIDRWLANPTIVHYTGSHKPWEYKCYHPFRREYLNYLRLTPFADYRLPKGRLKDVLETHINPLLWQLGLAKRKYRKF